MEFKIFIVGLTISFIGFVVMLVALVKVMSKGG